MSIQWKMLVGGELMANCINLQRLGWNNSWLSAIFQSISGIWLSKYNLLGQIYNYYTFSMGKPIIVYKMFLLLLNGQPISNPYFKLWTSPSNLQNIQYVYNIYICKPFVKCFFFKSKYIAELANIFSRYNIESMDLATISPLNISNTLTKVIADVS